MAQHAHPHAAELRNDDGSWRYTNALINQTSPYLLQHAHNPVDWHPWGPDAFERASTQGKPIFLSVGYSTCYWCHVMERQVFENPAIAAKMNELFINIKVDREERPDVDDLYMTATQLMTRSGGWPMSVFLTPPGAHDARGLKPFWCGTYLPPEPMHGRPSFPQVLDALHIAWTTRRSEVIDQANHVADAVTQTLAEAQEPGPLDAATITAAANALLKTYDTDDGGFGASPGTGPKFPQPANLQFLFAVAANNPAGNISDALHHTLDRMARGGMYDHVGGGFHRYSVDEKWLVPHFEKMLYDNGQLLSVYAYAITEAHRSDSCDAHRLTHYQHVLRETADYILREMVDDSGAFWSAQDAEVNAREGENYLWTPRQIAQAIDDTELADLACRLYGLTDGPNFRDPHDRDAPPTNVLHLPAAPHQLAAELGITPDEMWEQRRRINQQLYTARQQRDQPSTDDKVLASWNGLMIRGLAEAGAALAEPRYIDAAAKAADAIAQHMTASDGSLFRCMRRGQASVAAFLEDYTHYVGGLVALHRAGSGAGRYLDLACRLTSHAIDRFAHPVGGYFDTLADQADLFVRIRSTYDGAVPNGNSVMLHNLLDLYELTGDVPCLDRALADLRSFSRPMQQRGSGMIHTQHALLRALELAPDQSSITTADHPGPVQATAAWIDHTTLRVTVIIAPGHHINAPYTDDPALTPTTLELLGPGNLRVHYPNPTSKRYPFASSLLAVYEGELLIEVALSNTDKSSQLLLRCQPCSDTACLTPQTITVTIPPR